VLLRHNTVRKGAAAMAKSTTRTGTGVIRNGAKLTKATTKSEAAEAIRAADNAAESKASFGRERKRMIRLGLITEAHKVPASYFTNQTRIVREQYLAAGIIRQAS